MPNSKKIDRNSTVAVIGAGVMGVGIAQIAASKGYAVKLCDQNQKIVEAAYLGLSESLQKRVNKGKISTDEKNKLLSNIQLVSDVEQLTDCSIAIEVIVENLEIKQSLFKKLESILADDAVIATNTSSFAISALAKELNFPERFIGMHFFNPAPVLKLVEVVSGLKTDSCVANSIFALAEDWGKKPVQVKSSPGFIVNRVARPYYAEALKSLHEGAASVATIDTIMQAAMGFKLGPFQLIDLIGLDVNQAATESIYNAYFQDPRFRPSVLLKEMVDAGLLGRKSQQGFYDYKSERPHQEASYLDYDETLLISKISVYGDLGIAEPLLDIAREKEIKVNRYNSKHAYIEVGGTRLQMSNGLTASEVAAHSGHNNTILFDVVADFKLSKVIAISKAVQAEPNSIKLATALLHKLDKKIALLKDVPGLLVLRTMCMLANEAAETANQGIAETDSIDMAMKLGAAYPIGPIEWARSFGFNKTVESLQNIQGSYNEERYRCSTWLKLQAHS